MSEGPLNAVLLAGRFELRGTSNYTLRLAERLDEYDVRPVVICSDVRQLDPERRSRLPIREYRHVDVPVVGRLIREWIVPPLHEQPPDIIHVQTRQMLPLGAWLAERLDRPFLLTVHDFPPPGRRMKWPARHGRGVIAVSESVKAAVLKSFGLPEDAVTVIHSGVEPNPDIDVLPVLDPAHVPVVGTAGPLEAVKGLPYFLAAAQRVHDFREDVEFVIAGAGPEEHNLRRLARSLHIDHQVTFVPKLKDFTASLAAMDIFCLSSLQQGLGTIMLEAMAMGKPVIATGVGGVYSVIRDGRTGLLVPPSESAPLADRILELLADPVKARAIGEAGRAIVRRDFRVEFMVENTANLYRQAIAEWQPALDKVSLR